MRTILTATLALFATASSIAQFPIIDMHVHALPATFAGEPGAVHPKTGESAPATESAIMQDSLKANLGFDAPE